MLRDRLNALHEVNYKEAVKKLEAAVANRGAVSPMHFGLEQLHTLLCLDIRQMEKFIPMLRDRDGVCITKHCEDRPCTSPYYKITW